MTPLGGKDIRARLEEAIRETARVGRCRSIALARKDGLVVVHRVEPGHDPRLAAAMAAATVGGASAAAGELQQGKVERVIIECTEGKIVALESGRGTILLAIYDRGANLGLALHGLTQTAETISEILTEFEGITPSPV